MPPSFTPIELARILRDSKREIQNVRIRRGMKHMEQDIDDPDVIDAEVLVARIASLESKIAALVNVMISKGWSREVARYPIFGVVAYKQDESL